MACFNFRVLLLIATVLSTRNFINVVVADDDDRSRQQKMNGQAEICFVGFVMDQFCIGRGTLLDRPSVVTLEGPELHTVHCLVDVGRCVNSGYELLLEEPDEEGRHARAYVLDDAGNNQVLSVARRLGTDCSTCTGDEGFIEEGFRATVRGFIEPDSGTPVRLRVTTVEAPTVGCGEDGIFIPDNVTTTNEGAGGGGGLDPVKLHGGLMMTAWGFMLPSGVLSALLLRHRGGGVWFQYHRTLQSVGYSLAVLGFIVAFRNFGNVFADGMGPSYRHGILGLCTMIGGFLQALSGMARPHAPEQGKSKTVARLVFELFHKSLGYITLALAYGTLYLGSEIAGLSKDAFRGAWIATFVYAGVLIVGGLLDKFVVFPKTNATNTRAEEMAVAPAPGNDFEDDDDNDDDEDKTGDVEQITDPTNAKPQ